MKQHSNSFLDLVKNALKEVGELGVKDLKDKINNKEEFILIDVREESEWNKGKIPGSMYLGKGIIERDIETSIPNKQLEMVLYCQGGFRSALAAKSLKEMGYMNVLSLKGGFGEWVNSKYPVN